MPYLYTVEKKINPHVIIVVFVVFSVIAVSSFFIIYNYIQGKRLSSIYNYMDLGDYGNASFIFTDLYTDYPVDEAVIKAGIDLYYDILVRSSNDDEYAALKTPSVYNDRDALIDASEKVAIYSKQLLLLHPNSRNIWLIYQRLGTAYKNLGFSYYNEAYRAYISAIEAGDLRSDTVINLANICYGIGYYDDAILYLENAIKSEGNDGREFQIKLYYELSNAYEGSKNYTKAIQLLTSLEKEKIDDTILYYNINSKLGGLYLRQGIYNESEFFYRRAMEIDSQNPDVYYNMGLLYQTIGKRSDAIYMYREALAVNSGHVLAREALRRL